MYKIRITTTQGIVETEIENINELEQLLIPYYEIYIGLEAKYYEKQQTQQLVLKK